MMHFYADIMTTEECRAGNTFIAPMTGKQDIYIDIIHNYIDPLICMRIYYSTILKNEISWDDAKLRVQLICKLLTG